MRTQLINIIFMFLGISLGHSQEIMELKSVDISDAIEDQFRFDHAIDVNNIQVEVHEGIAELQGTVNNIKAKERATRLTEMVKGVRSVSNQIHVSPYLILSDVEIKENVETALLMNAATDSYKLDVSVDDGNVTLTGVLDSYQEKALCADVAKSVNGVVAMEDNMNVNFKTDRKDVTIENEIEAALKWNVTIDDGLIQVDSKKGNVTLTGVVGSAAEKRNAKWTAWVAGVKSIDDSRLTVEWWAKDSDLRANKNVEISDDEIKDAILAAALYDPRVSFTNTYVTVDDGWVTLRGTADNLNVKEAAKHLAEHTLGVHGVDNRIKVIGALEPSDQTIEENIAQALDLNSTTQPWGISVDVSNGTATLSGVVDSYIEKSEAEWVASGINGVTTVDNKLGVDYPYSYYFYGNSPYYEWYHPTPTSTETISLLGDEKIKRNVINELWWSPYVTASQVDVSVNNGIVTLEGVVDSYKEYEKTLENAWEGGATALNDQLTIEI